MDSFNKVAPESASKAVKVPTVNRHKRMRLASLFDEMNGNQIMMMYLSQYQRLSHTMVQNALRTACAREGSESIQIHMTWSVDKFKQALELLCDFVRKITFVGKEFSSTLVLEQETIIKISMVALICPNIRDLKMQMLTMRLLDTYPIRSFKQLISIEVTYCIGEEGTTHDDRRRFVAFFTSNRRLEHVKIYCSQENGQYDDHFMETLLTMKDLIAECVVPKLPVLRTLILYNGEGIKFFKLK